MHRFKLTTYLFFVPILFVFSFLFLSTNTQAKVNCCVYTHPNNAYNNRTDNFKEAGTPSCSPVSDVSACLSKDQLKFRLLGLGGSYRQEAYVVPNCEEYCKTKEQVFSKILYASKCCAAWKGNSLECVDVAYDTQRCSIPNMSLYGYSCARVAGCSNYHQVQPLGQKLKDARSNAEKIVETSINTQQVKPSLGVPIPGLTLGSITLSPKDAAGKRYISIPWIAQLIEAIYNYAIGIAGLIAVIMLMYGGFTWILSGGDPSRISSAKESIKSAVLGLVLVMSSYTILNFVNPSLVSPDSLKIELPELREEAERNEQFMRECDYVLINKGIKSKLTKTPSGQLFCPDYSKLKSPLTSLDATYFQKSGSNLVVSDATLKGLVAVQNKIKQHTSFYGGIKITIMGRPQSLQSQAGLCQGKLTRRQTHGENIQLTGSEKAFYQPSCATSKFLNGNQIEISVTGGIKWDCGQTNEDSDCRSSTNSVSQLDKKIKAGKCAKNHTTCQDNLKNLMNGAGGFSVDPKRWWVFSK